jgi:hypothetical protein
MSESVFTTVLNKIRYLVFTQCKDLVLYEKWIAEFGWYDVFEEENKRKNLAPEVLEEIRWARLRHMLDACIGDWTNKSGWEKRVIDIFSGQDQGADEPPEYDAAYDAAYEQPEYQDDEYYYYDEEEWNEQLQLARQEEAASRHEERRERY